MTKPEFIEFVGIAVLTIISMFFASRNVRLLEWKRSLFWAIILLIITIWIVVFH